MIAWAGLERLRLGLADGLDRPAAAARWPVSTAPPPERAGVSTPMPPAAGGSEPARRHRRRRLGNGARDVVAARAGGRCSALGARSGTVVAAINGGTENPIFLPADPLDPGIRATTDLAAAVVARGRGAARRAAQQFLRRRARRPRAASCAGLPMLLCAKGIETGSLTTMSEVGGRNPARRRRVAVLSGPTFAAEVARGLPSCGDDRRRDRGARSRFVAALGSPRFRPYPSDDPIGAEIGGAVKNVLAIACGIIDRARPGRQRAGRR